MIDGILALDKPQGWTSHDAVARVRRVAGQRQVGHAGTLDPLATGLLLLVLGRATRVSGFLMQGTKEYCAEVVLGATTSTDDVEGPIISRHPVPALSPAQLYACLQRFVGEIEQVPPAYAAVRQGGQRLYTLARQGIEVAAPPRRVTVQEIALERIELPRLRLRVRCGSGTYIRSLARDIGSALGTGAYLHALRRTRSGGFAVSEAVRVEGLTAGLIATSITPVDRAVLDWPAVVLSLEEAQGVCQGRPVALGDALEGNVRLYGPSRALIAFGAAANGLVRPFRVFAEVNAHAGRS